MYFAYGVAFYSFVLLIIKVRQNNNQRPSIRDQVIKNGTDVYDFVIVGGGTSGCVLAARLSENENFRVLLVEAGLEQGVNSTIPGLTLSAVRDYYNVSVSKTSKPNQSFPFPKMLGGGSQLNLMIYNRGNPKDYDGWAEAGNWGWSYSDMLPYFIKSEKAEDPWVLEKAPEAHGTSGPISVGRFKTRDPNGPTVLQAYAEVGLNRVEYNSGKQIGANYLQFTTKNGDRESTYSAYLKPILKDRKNLVVLTNYTATSIIFDNKIAYGVNFMHNLSKKNKTAYASKEVLLSAGGIGSPKLLLLSGIGPRSHLQESKVKVHHELPAVGENVQDHVRISVVNFQVPEPRPYVSESLVKVELDKWHLNRTGPFASAGLCDTIAYLDSRYFDCAKTMYTFETHVVRPTFECPKRSLRCPEVTEDLPDLQCYVWGELKERTHEKFLSSYPLTYYESANVGFMLLDPESRGILRLNQTDIYSTPEIFLNALDNPRDLEKMVRGVKFFELFTNTSTIRQLSPRLFNLNVAEKCGNQTHQPFRECLVERTVEPGYHVVGSCKMGQSASDSVVDSRLRVHGLKSLRVIDASIMPTIPRGNTMAPTIAIAEKGADMVIDRYKTILEVLVDFYLDCFVSVFYWMPKVIRNDCYKILLKPLVDLCRSYYSKIYSVFNIFIFLFRVCRKYVLYFLNIFFLL